jgi:hypothetical protein
MSIASALRPTLVAVSHTLAGCSPAKEHTVRLLPGQRERFRAEGGINADPSVTGVDLR